jgi:hypothetical protein
LLLSFALRPPSISRRTATPCQKMAAFSPAGRDAVGPTARKAETRRELAARQTRTNAAGDPHPLRSEQGFAAVFHSKQSDTLGHGLIKPDEQVSRKSDDSVIDGSATQRAVTAAVVLPWSNGPAASNEAFWRRRSPRPALGPSILRHPVRPRGGEDRPCF